MTYTDYNLYEEDITYVNNTIILTDDPTFITKGKVRHKYSIKGKYMIFFVCLFIFMIFIFTLSIIVLIFTLYMNNLPFLV